MTTAEQTAEMQCPQCASTLPVHEGYPTWCSQCEWNLRTEPDRPATLIGNLYASLGRRHSAALFQRITDSGRIRPPLTAGTVVAYLWAGTVHLCTLALLCLGCALVVAGWPNPLLVIVGVCCLGAVWLARPGVMPEPVVLSREEFPAIYELADRVAEHLGAARVDGIAVDGTYNAYFGRAGWRRRRILGLGLPLWTVLTDEERLDLIAHELAHSVNNDYRNGLVIGTAVDTLHRMYVLLYPERLLPTEIGLFAFAALPFTLLSLVAAQGVRLCALGLGYLLWSNAQRAEYYADILAATLSGRAAATGSMEKLLFDRIYRNEVRRVALQRGERDDLFERLRCSIEAVPGRERERLLRIGQREMEGIERTHPPLFLRLRMIDLYAPAGPSLHLAPALYAEADREMRTLRPAVQASVIERYRAELYD